MKDSRLYQLFGSLSKRDHREIAKLVRSPYFNQRADVIRLFDYLSPLAKKQTDAWEREKLFSVIYQTEAFDVNKLRHVCSFLAEFIRKYFILEEQEQQPFTQQLLLCQALRKRGLVADHEVQWKKLEKLRTNAKYKNIQFHHQHFLFFFQREDFNNHHRQNRKGYLFLAETAFHLSAHYMSGILRQACMLLSQRNLWTGDLQLPLLPEILREIKAGKYENSLAVNIYYYAYQALSDLKNIEDFYALKKLILANWPSFPATEMRDIYLIAINYCIKQLNQGNRKFVEEALNLYKHGLDNKVLLEDGQLSAFDYKNTLRLSLALKEYEWADKFIKEYTKYLPAKERQNTYQYNLAYFYFNKPDYPKAMELLRHVEFNDVFNNLDARRMLLRMYYELKEFDALESLLDSFKVYIHRQKNIGYHRTNYLNLIRFVRRMLKGDVDTKAKRKKLREKVEATESVAEKEWLLGMLKGT